MPVVEPGDERDLEALLGDVRCRVIEREPHVGDFNAVIWLVDHEPDKERILARPLPAGVINAFRARGFAEEETSRSFRAFVLGGEGAVRVEIIVSDYADMLESEIGRCMHEERIIRQRAQPAYRGQLAQNLAFLLEYLFTLPSAPNGPSERLPVRLWDRYLPDYFDEVRRRLFHLPSSELTDL